MKEKLLLEKSYHLYRKSLEIVPGGSLGVRRPTFYIGEEYPLFLKSGNGGRVLDVDGNEYVDLICGYGPLILGHREKEIDDAVCEKLKTHGYCFALTHEMQLELAQKLTEIIPCAEMCLFAKTGSDVTTTAIRIARHVTKRNKVLRCGYHGWHEWCVTGKGGIPKKAYEDILPFPYGDLNLLEDLLKEHGDDTAAIIITPVEHELNRPVKDPEPGYLEGVKELADKHGALLIFDEIRTGFRYHIGGAQRWFGVTPQLAAFGKGLANGFAISALVGAKEYMQAAADAVYISATYYSDGLAQLAALKTIEILERENVPQALREKGNRFAQRVEALIKKSAVPCLYSGSPFMPYFTFHSGDESKDRRMRDVFFTSLIRNRILIGPNHHG
ncbi:MAG: aminotransferase class III-fold pyridoxal phosphate-dependent enzyme, partial [Deltaproteobacteria bacterium]|nr:aminotransferase class III-fold pyridoxal phosphate-dependent enzyme [Deltaproteobacteria bacterium]